MKSMTGMASLAGDLPGWAWSWDIRSVNARGLDLRLRLPDGIEGLDAAARKALAQAVARGAVTLGLKLSRPESSAAERLNDDALRQALAHIASIETAAAAQGLALAPTKASDVLGLRGVLGAETGSEDSAALRDAVLAQLPELIAGFLKMRAEEGHALQALLAAQIDEIARLTEEASTLAEARKADWQAKLETDLANVMAHAEGAEPARVAQELAVIAVKADVTEEIDRLRAHVAAAREHLGAKGPIGRKLDFLAQEFNREANTLCAKAQSNALTRVGLDLKATIDQMREQVQNVE